MSITGILIALLLVGLNGFFVGAEFAIIKVRATRIEEMAREGSHPARVVQRIHHNLDSYLSATQMGVTLASLALGWVGEPAIAAIIEPLFEHLGSLLSKVVAHGIGVTVAFTVITYFHIVFGELAPKWLAIQNPEKLAVIVALPLDLFHRIFYPLIWFLNTTAKVLLSRLGIRPASEGETTLSEAELRIALTQSEEGGAITESAGEIADRAFHFGHGKVRDVMTPRPEVAFLCIDWPLAQNLEIVHQTRFARYPVCRGDLENVVGRIHVRDLLPLARETGRSQAETSAALEAICQPVLYVPETKALDTMLEDFRQRRMEMAIVQDEYGVTAGVVTLEDVLEELVGEIQQEFVPAPSEVDIQSDGSYLVDSKITLARLVREYGVGEEVEGVETIGGYILSTHTGHPRLGYRAHLGDWAAEVTEMSGRRIRRVRLLRVSAPVEAVGGEPGSPT
jgi:CBS domain containing-hemolysin-like protein